MCEILYTRNFLRIRYTDILPSSKTTLPMFLLKYLLGGSYTVSFESNTGVNLIP